MGDMSDTTRKARKGFIICTLLSWAIVFLPVIGYVIYGYIVSDTIHKITLTTTVMAAIILTIISIVLKKQLRCSIFILLLGIYFAIQKIEVVIIILAITTLVDELILQPLQKHFRSKFIINKEIDRRIT